MDFASKSRMKPGSSEDKLISSDTNTDEHENDQEEEITSADSNVPLTNQPQLSKSQALLSDPKNVSENRSKSIDEEDSEEVTTSAKDTDSKDLPSKASGYMSLKNEGDNVSALKRMKKQSRQSPSFSDDSPIKGFKSHAAAPPSTPKYDPDSLREANRVAFNSVANENELIITPENCENLRNAIKKVLDSNQSSEFMIFKKDVESHILYEMVEKMNKSPNEQKQLKLTFEDFEHLINYLRSCTFFQFGELCLQFKNSDNDPEKTDNNCEMITKAQLQKVWAEFSPLKNAHVGSDIRSIFNARIRDTSNDNIDYTKLLKDINNCINQGDSSSEQSQSENESIQPSSSS